MRIAVIGSGAVGCLYGARLGRAGHDVHFLMRRDLDAVRRHGLMIHSCDGDFHLPAKAYARSEDIGPVDLVICALKTTNLDVAEALIRPCMGPTTNLLALMNGLGVEERFAEWFGAANIFGGLAFVCSNRGEPGHVHHLSYGRLVFAHLLDDLDRTRGIADLFAAAGLTTSVAPSLVQARWEKLVWNIPFSTLAVTAGAVTTRHIMEDDGLRELARLLMVETIAAGNANRCTLDAEPLVEKMFANTATMGDYKPSMLIDYQCKRELEVESILGEPVRRAAALNVAVPHMAMQYRLASFLDRLNRGLIQ
ncbi:MAG: 2-dehydropantoate 2-reductase [Phycisphaerae bacterium]|nr:2-dehydropantoate 2-reductase [Phycisphaerae bacterium]